MASSRMLRDLAIQPYIGFGSGYQGRGYPSRSDYVQHAQSPATGSFVADIRVRRPAALGRSATVNPSARTDRRFATQSCPSRGAAIGQCENNK